MIGASLGPETGFWPDQAKIEVGRSGFCHAADRVLAGDWPANTAPFELLVSEAVHERPPLGGRLKKLRAQRVDLSANPSARACHQDIHTSVLSQIPYIDGRANKGPGHSNCPLLLLPWFKYRQDVLVSVRPDLPLRHLLFLLDSSPLLQ